MTRSRRLATILLSIAFLIVAGRFLLKRYCPQEGIAFSREQRNLHRLKNRTALPQESDFDARVRLAKMLEPGEDSSRWSNSRAARLEGYVVSVGQGSVELTNCYLPCNRDTHIHLALQTGATSIEQVVVEITPRLEDWAKQQGRDWSEGTLKQELIGHWCHFEGWLFFDSDHRNESENTVPHGPNNWRATAWEIHPVTSIEVVR